jgi:ribosome-binding factor A
VYHCRKGIDKNMLKKPTNSNRSEKIASKVQTLVAQILQHDFSDDDLIRGVSLVGAEAHGGMQFVKLFFYVRANRDETQQRLNEITKMVRFELAKKIDQKYVPEIRFVYDDTLERADRIEELLNNLEK